MRSPPLNNTPRHSPIQVLRVGCPEGRRHRRRPELGAARPSTDLAATEPTPPYDAVAVRYRGAGSYRGFPRSPRGAARDAQAARIRLVRVVDASAALCAVGHRHRPRFTGGRKIRVPATTGPTSTQNSSRRPSLVARPQASRAVRFVHAQPLYVGASMPDVRSHPDAGPTSCSGERQGECGTRISSPVRRPDAGELVAYGGCAGGAGGAAICAAASTLSNSARSAVSRGSSCPYTCRASVKKASAIASSTP